MNSFLAFCIRSALLNVSFVELSSLVNLSRTDANFTAIASVKPSRLPIFLANKFMLSIKLFRDCALDKSIEFIAFAKFSTSFVCLVNFSILSVVI